MRVEELNRHYSTAAPYASVENVEIKQYFYTDLDKIDIAVPRSGAPMGMFLSGGPDSALTTYLLAKTIKEFGFNNPVYPITTEFLARPYNIKYAWGVLRKVEELLDFKFEQHLIFPMPNHALPISDEDKKVIMSSNIQEYDDRYNLNCIVNGLTANPPITEVGDTLYGDSSKERDEADVILQKLKSKRVQYPFLFSNKRVVSHFYNKFDLLETLFPITRSCEAEMKETEYFTKDCFEVRPKDQCCWWCRERQWGFEQYRPDDFINRFKG